jgi:lysophospholipase L1-like esterase
MMPMPRGVDSARAPRRAAGLLVRKGSLLPAGLVIASTAAVGTVGQAAQVQPAPVRSIHLVCTEKAHTGTLPLTATQRYSDAAAANAFGFDLTSSPSVSGGACTGSGVFFVSVAEPEGNYRVTVQFGGDRAAVTTVKAESRRLMLEQVTTARGATVKRSFVVNIRTDRVTGGEKVHLKPREVGSLDWDRKLTLEFIGTHPSVRSIVIEPVTIPTVYIAGDSTVVDQDKAPWAAWGQILPSFFNDRIAIANDAESGETIRSFVSEKRFDKIMTTLHQGDYLFMQFAHNDQKPGPGFVPIPMYKDLLRHYIELARAKGAHPVLVTSMMRRDFAPDGTLRHTLAGYPDAMREVARAETVPLIDLNAMSRQLFEAMGPEGTLRAFVHYAADTFPGQTMALADNTHFNSYGALELAKCVVHGIRQTHMPLQRYLRKDVPHFDPAHPDPPDIWTVPPDSFWSAQTPYER